MTETPYCVCFSTVPDPLAAEKISLALVDQKLAACVNRVGPIRSLYRWEGAVENSEEYLLVIKTSLDKYPLVEKTIKDHHPYSVPEIISLPVTSGYGPYLNWIADSLSTGKPVQTDS